MFLLQRVHYKIQLQSMYKDEKEPVPKGLSHQIKKNSPEDGDFGTLIYIVSGVNAANQLTGRFDPEIGDTLLKDTRMLAEFLCDTEIEFMACSPQRRARAT